MSTSNTLTGKRVVEARERGARNREASHAGIAAATFGAAPLVTLLSVANANWVRVKKISVRLPNLPDVWRGRTAILASDLHLGHVHHRGFSHRIVRKIGALKPDVVFLAGDFF